MRWAQMHHVSASCGTTARVRIRCVGNAGSCGRRAYAPCTRPLQTRYKNWRVLWQRKPRPGSFRVACMFLCRCRHRQAWQVSGRRSIRSLDPRRMWVPLLCLRRTFWWSHCRQGPAESSRSFHQERRFRLAPMVPRRNRCYILLRCRYSSGNRHLQRCSHFGRWHHHR